MMTSTNISFTHKYCYHLIFEYVKKRCTLHTDVLMDHDSNSDRFTLLRADKKLVLERNAKTKRFVVKCDDESLLELTYEQLHCLLNPKSLFNIVDCLSSLRKACSLSFQIIKSQLIVPDSKIEFSCDLKSILSKFDKTFESEANKKFTLQCINGKSFGNNDGDFFALNRCLILSPSVLQNISNLDQQKLLIDLAWCFFEAFWNSPVCCEMQSFAKNAFIFPHFKYSKLYLEYFCDPYLKIAKVLFPILEKEEDKLLKKPYFQIVPASLINMRKPYQYLSKLRKVDVVFLQNAQYVRVCDFFDITLETFFRLRNCDRFKYAKENAKIFNEALKFYRLGDILFPLDGISFQAQNLHELINDDYNPNYVEMISDIKYFSQCEDSGCGLVKDVVLIRGLPLAFSLENLNRNPNILKDPSFKMLLSVCGNVDVWKPYLSTIYHKSCNEWYNNRYNQKPVFIHERVREPNDTFDSSYLRKIADAIQKLENDHGIILFYDTGMFHTPGILDKKTFLSFMIERFSILNENKLNILFNKILKESDSCFFDWTPENMITLSLFTNTSFNDLFTVAPSLLLTEFACGFINKIITAEQNSPYLKHFDSSKFLTWKVSPQRIGDEKKNELKSFICTIQPLFLNLLDEHWNNARFRWIQIFFIDHDTKEFQNMLKKISDTGIELSCIANQIIISKCLSIPLKSVWAHIDSQRLIDICNDMEKIEPIEHTRLYFGHNILKFDDGIIPEYDVNNMENQRKFLKFFELLKVSVPDGTTLKPRYLFNSLTLSGNLNVSFSILAGLWKSTYPQLKRILVNYSNLGLFTRTDVFMNLNTGILSETTPFYKVLENDKKIYVKILKHLSPALTMVFDKYDIFEIFPKTLLISDPTTFYEKLQACEKENIHVVLAPDGTLNIGLIELTIQHFLAITDVHILIKFHHQLSAFSKQVEYDYFISATGMISKQYTRTMENNRDVIVKSEFNQHYQRDLAVFVEQLLESKQNMNIKDFKIRINSNGAVKLENALWGYPDDLTSNNERRIISEMANNPILRNKLISTSQNDKEGLLKLSQSFNSMFFKKQNFIMKTVDLADGEGQILAKTINPLLESFTKTMLSHIECIPANVNTDETQQLTKLFQNLESRGIQWLLLLSGNTLLENCLIVTFKHLLKTDIEKISLLVKKLKEMSDGHWGIQRKMLKCQEEIEMDDMQCRRTMETTIDYTNVVQAREKADKLLKTDPKKNVTGARIERNGTLFFSKNLWIQAHEFFQSSDNKDDNHFYEISKKCADCFGEESKFSWGTIFCPVAPPDWITIDQELQYCELFHNALQELCSQKNKNITMTYHVDTKIFNYNNCLSIHPRMFLHLVNVEIFLEILLGIDVIVNSNSNQDIVDKAIVNFLETKLTKEEKDNWREHNRIVFEPVRRHCLKMIGKILYDYVEEMTTKCPKLPDWLLEIKLINDPEKLYGLEDITIKNFKIFCYGFDVSLFSYDQNGSLQLFAPSEAFIIALKYVSLRLTEKCENLNDFFSVVDTVHSYGSGKYVDATGKRSQRKKQDLKSIFDDDKNNQRNFDNMVYELEKELERVQITQTQPKYKYKMENNICGLHHWFKHGEIAENIGEYYLQFEKLFQNSNFLYREVDSQDGQKIYKTYENDNLMGILLGEFQVVTLFPPKKKKETFSNLQSNQNLLALIDTKFNGGSKTGKKTIMVEILENKDTKKIIESISEEQANLIHQILLIFTGTISKTEIKNLLESIKNKKMPNLQKVMVCFDNDKKTADLPLDSRFKKYLVKDEFLRLNIVGVSKFGGSSNNIRQQFIEHMFN